METAEPSSSDIRLLLGGVCLRARQHFSGMTEFRILLLAIYEPIDWAWMHNERPRLFHGMEAGWRFLFSVVALAHYCELIDDLFAGLLGSPTHSVPGENREGLVASEK